MGSIPISYADIDAETNVIQVDFGFGKTRNEVIQLCEKVRKRIVEIETE